MGRIIKMKSCKIEATLLKATIEEETCDLQNKIMEYQGLGLDGLEREYNQSIGLYVSDETDLIDSIASLKNMDEAIEVLNQGQFRGDQIKSLLEKMMALAHNAADVHNVQTDIEDTEKVMTKIQELLEQYKKNIDLVVTTNSDDTYDQYFNGLGTKSVNFLATRDFAGLQHIECESLLLSTLNPELMDESGNYLDVGVLSTQDASTTYVKLVEAHKEVENKIHRMLVQKKGLENRRGWVNIQRGMFEEKIQKWKKEQIGKLLDQIATNHQRLSVIDVMIS